MPIPATPIRAGAAFGGSDARTEDGQNRKPEFLQGECAVRRPPSGCRFSQRVLGWRAISANKGEGPVQGVAGVTGACNFARNHTPHGWASG